MAMVLVAKERPTKVFDGAKLLELRTARALSQAELAELADVSAMDVSRYERGLVVPSFDVVCRLADALGVELPEFRAKPE